MKNKPKNTSSKKKLSEIDNSSKTCYHLHQLHQVECEQSDCRHWINSESCQNCVLISAKKGSKTLQEIGDMYGITRMRICQIEKNAIIKLAKKRKRMEF